MQKLHCYNRTRHCKMLHQVDSSWRSWLHQTNPVSSGQVIPTPPSSADTNHRQPQHWPQRLLLRLRCCRVTIGELELRNLKRFRRLCLLRSTQRRRCEYTSLYVSCFALTQCYSTVLFVRIPDWLAKRNAMVTFYVEGIPLSA